MGSNPPSVPLRNLSGTPPWSPPPAPAPMAASPETDALLSIGDTYTSTSAPSPPVLIPAQANSALTTAAPPEPAQLDPATPTSPPPPAQDTAEYSDPGEFPPPKDCRDLAPSLPPPGASPALEAASPEKPASSPPCPPGAPLEGFLDVTASAGSAPPAPQIGEAPPEVAPQPLSPLPTPPAKTSPCAALDSSTTEAAAMASPEAASPPPASESDSHSAPATLTPPLGNGPEGLSPEQHPQLAAPEISPQVCENSAPAQPPPPQAGSTYVLSDAAVDEVVAVVSTEVAGSSLALESTEGERDTAPDVPPPLESGAEGELPQQQPRSPHSEMVPPRCQNSEPAELLELPPPPAESTYCSPEAALNEVAAVASEEAAPVLDGTGGDAALESPSEGPLQEPMQTSSTSPKMEAEPCSPDMAPPGFENFKSKWLPQPAHTLPVESTHYLLEASAADTADVVPEAATGSLPALETMGAEMNISPGQLPSSKSAEDRPLHHPLKVTSSPATEAAPCSPDMPPPGFENFKPSWLPQPTVAPSAETTYLLDVATTKEEYVEKPGSVMALDTMYMETDTARDVLPTLEGGAGGLLQLPEPSSPSTKMQPAPCSPYITPQGLESLTSPQLQLPSPVAQTSHISQDSAATGAVCLTSDNAPQPSPVLEATDATPELATSLESGARESMQQVPSRLPFCSVQGTTCSLEIASSGSENSESLADAVITTVTVEAVDHPLTVAEAKEEAKGHILPLPQENGCDRPLPYLEPKASSLVVQAAPRSPEITPIGFESLESSQQTSPRLAERIDSPSHLPVTESATVKSEKTVQPLSPLQATDTDMESALVLQSPLKSKEKSLPHPQHQASSPSGKDVPCSPDTAPPGFENLDSSEELPLQLSFCPNFEMGQMVCGCCRDLIAYPRGATHVQCFGCWTINLVLEAHEVGKVYCGQCETLLMFPFGAPAVRCSTCLFVTEIGERNVRPRVSVEQGMSPPPQELGEA